MRQAIALLSLLLACFSQVPQADELRSKAGALFLDGGSSDPAIGTAFGRRAGGRNGRLLIVPTALPDSALSPINLRAMPQTAETYFGVSNISVLHAVTKAEADSELFCSSLQTASAIFFMGGEHNRILDRYAGTRFESELLQFHRRGGLIGGSSAGAMVIGSYQANRHRAKGGRIVDQPSNWRGFALLSDTIVDVHFSERRRQGHIPPILKKHPRLRAIGIDERTAAIVHPTGAIDVIGRGSVTLFHLNELRVLRASER